MLHYFHGPTGLDVSTNDLSLTGSRVEEEHGEKRGGMGPRSRLSSLKVEWKVQGNYVDGGGPQVSLTF